MIKILLFTVFLTCAFEACWGQDANHFSGTLTYRIERVDVKDSVEAKMIIFARDSLIKIVNFSSDFGKQETIKHLIYQKKYVLIELDQEKFAVQIKDSPEDTSKRTYTFHSEKGHSKIAGIRGKKLAAKFSLVQNELTVVYTPKISAQYLGSFTDAPGLLLQYFVVNDHGLYKYTLESIDKKVPPISLFMIPADYQKISLKAFMEKSADSGNSSIPNN
ncbi:MAG: hypothetical protein KA736_07990 [Crocinitomicaceae bacterium]|nr:hypothetical protein [Crocinitomicaceae bacterium]MBP6033285.1 hypothetical protein [Crocinitomicaceae bacterium]